MRNEQFDALSAEAKRLYRRIVREWGIKEEPGATILLTAAQALDRMREAQVILRTEGLIATDRWGQRKPHPASQIEKESRAHFLQSVKALNLDLESLEGD